MNITVNAAVGRIPQPPSVMPGWAKNPSPPPNSPGTAGAKPVATKVPPIKAYVTVITPLLLQISLVTHSSPAVEHPMQHLPPWS